MELHHTAGQKARTLLSPFVMQLLFIMFFVEFVKGALLVTFLPIYLKTGLGATGVVIGWTLAMQYIGDNLFRTPIGWFIDKIGYRFVMLTGVLVTLTSVLMIALSGEYVVIIIACALLGVGTAPLWPCVITGTTEIGGEKARGTVMSVVYVAWISGVGVGPFVITFFMDTSYTAAFELLIGIMLAVILAAAFLPGRPGQGEAAATAKTLSRSGDVRNPREEPGRWERVKRYMGEVNRSLTVSWVFYPAMFFQTFAIGLLTPVLTIYATDELQLTLAQFRVFLVVGGGVTVLSMIPVGKLVDRYGTRRFLNVGFSLTCGVLLLFPFVREISLLYLLVSLLGTGFALVIPAWNAFIASVIPPEKKGAIWGFFLTIEGAGTTVGPIISGLLWDYAGPGAPFLVSGVVFGSLLLVKRFISLQRRVVVP